MKPLLNALINEAGFWIAEPLRNSVLQLVNEIDAPESSSTVSLFVPPGKIEPYNGEVVRRQASSNSDR